MIVYNVIYILNFILSILNIYSKNYLKLYLYFSFVILNIFLCFNYMNGIDWTSYQRIYLELPTLNEMLNKNSFNLGITGRNNSEIIFYYTIIMFKSLGFNYEMYQYFMLTLFLIIIYKTFKKCTCYPLVGIMMYYSVFLLSNIFEPAMRQLLAIGFFYISLNDIYTKNKVKFLIKNLMGFFFHNSAIVLLLLYFIPLKRIKKNLIIGLSIIVLLVSNYLQEILEKISSYLPILNRYLFYLSSDEYGLKNSLTPTIVIMFIFSICLGWFVEKNKSLLKITSTSFFYLILNLFWINEICFILQRKLIVFYRIKYYFDIFYIIVLVWFIEIILKKYGKKIGVILVIFLAITYYRINFRIISYWVGKDTMKFIPYTNYIVENLFNKNIKKDFEKIHYRLNIRKKEMNYSEEEL